LNCDKFVKACELLASVEATLLSKFTVVPVVAAATPEVNRQVSEAAETRRIFVNAVNLTNVHQTHFDPLELPAQEPDGRWTTDVWAPLGGRVFNAGVKIEF